MPKPSFRVEWICSFLNPRCTLPTSFNLFPHGAQFPRCLARLSLLLNIQFEHIDPPPRISSCKSSASNCILFPESDILCQNRACLLRVFTYETLSLIVNLNLLQHSDTPHFKLKQASCLHTYVPTRTTASKACKGKLNHTLTHTKWGGSCSMGWNKHLLYSCE